MYSLRPARQVRGQLILVPLAAVVDRPGGRVVPVGYIGSGHLSLRTPPSLRGGGDATIQFMLLALPVWGRGTPTPPQGVGLGLAWSYFFSYFFLM